MVIANRFNRLGTYNDPIKDIGAIFKEKCEDVICKGHLDLECERLKPKRLYGKIKIKKLTGSLRRTKYNNSAENRCTHSRCLFGTLEICLHADKIPVMSL